MIQHDTFAALLKKPVRALRARVEIYNGSSLELVCGCHDRLREFSVERAGEGKFFGYGICQRLNVKLIDKARELNISTANSIEVEFGTGTEYIYPFPQFHVTEVHRDEKTNELSITAYDALYKAATHTVSDLDLIAPYTLGDFVTACGSLLGLPVDFGDIETFDLEFAEGANFEGTETIRDALNAAAEATQTIYYINRDWRLVFKRLDIEGEPIFSLDKSRYIELESGTNRRLATITHTTELGDNLTASTVETGTTQYIRDNPFWTMRDDLDILLDYAVAAVGGLTINQFDCSWRGDFLLELGDKIKLTNKDDTETYSYMLNDSLKFDGALSQRTLWKFDENDADTEATSSNLGDVLKRTYAKVDKINKEIELVASDVGANSEAISALQINTDSINASVEKIEDYTSSALDSINGNMAELTNRVNSTVTSEDLKIQIEEVLSNGIDKVITSTGFTFDDKGLSISKSGTEMETLITEDGMTVSRDGEDVLVANNEGVWAEDLHATTYLIIGRNSRFEDYKSSRTGCFWIGG